VREATKSALRDLQSLEQDATFKAQKVQFLLDATLGFINLAQNDIIKLFSVLAVIFMPPMMIASIYGMNFKTMPELDWSWGYPAAIVLMVLAGSCAILLFLRLRLGDLVYPALMFGLLPTGLLGVVAASFAAATMASVASTLNSASALITMDIIRRTAPSLSDLQVVRIGRLCTAGLLLVALLWAPQLESFRSLWQYLQAMLAYAVPPVVALFLGGLFWRGANAAGAATTLLVGTACGIALFLANVVFHWVHLHFLYVAPILLLIDSSILVAVSLRTGGASARDESLVWTIRYFRAESERLRTIPAWRNYRVQAAVLLALTACVVVIFR
jgi:SSS family solute:Na+ symporter